MSTNVPFDADFDVRAPLPPASGAVPQTFMSGTPPQVAFFLGISTAVAVCALIAAGVFFTLLSR